MSPIAIVDAGPLYAAISRQDRNHQRCLQFFDTTDLELVVPAMIVAEVCHLLGQRATPAIEAQFLRGLVDVEVEAPTRDDWEAIAGLVERYADFPLGGADASIIVLAERLNTDLIVTLDERHFRAVRMRDGRAFRLLPD